MVNARLHIICGNCGSKDMFEHKIRTEMDDMSEDENATRQVVYIACNNCVTVHDLNDYSTFKSE
jgi:hypothetical protein